MYFDSKSEIKAESGNQASKEFVANTYMDDNLLQIHSFNAGAFILESCKKKGSQMSDNEQVQHDLKRNTE